MPISLVNLARRVVNLESKVNRALTSPQLGNSSMEDARLEEYDKDGQLVSIIGKQPDGTHGAVVVSGPVPPRPSAPVVTGGPGLLNYGWDGNFADEDSDQTDISIPSPLDFARVEAHASPVQGFSADTATTLLDTFESPRGGSRTAMLEPGVWFVVLVSRALSGKRSVQSREVSVEVLAPIGSDIDVEALKEEFRAVDEQLNQALIANRAALSDAQGRIDTLAGRVNPVEAALSTLQESTLPGMQTAINGKNKTTNSTAVPSGTGYISGDTWQQWSSLATGGKLLAAWRYTTKWDPVILDPSYLPQVDIGSGTYGSLAGGRLDAGSVTTRELVVGSFTNLVENPAWEYGAKSWTGFSTGWTVEPSGGRRTAPVLRFTGTTARTFGPQSNLIPLDLAGEQVGDNTGAKFRVSGWVRTTSKGAARGELCLYTYAANGTTFLTNRNFSIDGATSEWKFFSTILEAPRANSAYVKLRINATLPNAADEYFFDDLSVVSAVEGNLIVENSITGREVHAESVGAAVGAFVKADIGNLVVTGNSNLNTLTAERIASNIGSFLKLYANQVIIGQPGNLIPDPMHQDAGMLARRNQYSTCTVTLRGSDFELNNTSTGLQYFRPMGSQQSQAGVTSGGWIPVTPGDVWEWTVSATGVKATGGWIKFVGRTKDGSAYANPTAQTTMAVGNGTYTVQATIPTNCYWIIPEMAVPAGVMLVDQGSMNLHQVITPALIVDGLMNGKRIVGASIETNGTSQRGIKLIDTGLHAWDAAGNLTFRLDAATGSSFASGTFESTAGGVTARLGAFTYSQGFNRPALVFNTSAAGSQPKIFAEGPGDAENNFGEGSLVLHSREKTVNSSGRSQLALFEDGRGGRLSNEFGAHNGIGFSWDGNKGYSTVTGRLWQHSLSQIRSGAGSQGTIAAGSFVEWTITHAAPPPDGFIRPAITADYDATSAVTYGVNTVIRTGFKVRAHNAAASSKWVAGFHWIGVWVAG